MPASGGNARLGLEGLPGIVRVMRGQPVAHEADTLGALLGDRGVGGPEFLGEFLDGPPAEVDLLDDVTHLLRQGLDGGAKVLESLISKDRMLRGDGLGRDGVHDDVVQRRQGPRGIGQGGFHHASFDTQGRCGLGDRRRAAKDPESVSWTDMVSLMRFRADRVAQSLARISSAKAPTIRRRANAPKGTPRFGSKESADVINATDPTDAKSSRDK